MCFRLVSRLFSCSVRSAHFPPRQIQIRPFPGALIRDMSSEEGRAPLCSTKREPPNPIINPHSILIQPSEQIICLANQRYTVISTLSGTKTNEFLVVLKSISLKGFFRLWGTFIGQFPLAFLISGLILCSLSCEFTFLHFMRDFWDRFHASGGIVKLHLRDNVRDGYTPRTSRSRLETDLYREFLGSEGKCNFFAWFVNEACTIRFSGDPAMTTVLMLAKDNGSMHRLNYLQVP